MLPLQITRDQFRELEALQVKHRRDWPAVFSTNARGDIWPFACFGPTPLEWRKEVAQLSAVVTELAQLYLDERVRGGRFFIDLQGAHYKLTNGERRTFVTFRVVGRRVR